MLIISFTNAPKSDSTIISSIAAFTFQYCLELDPEWSVSEVKENLAQQINSKDKEFR